MTAAGQDKAGEADGYGYCEPGGDRRPLPRFQNHFISGLKIYRRVADM